MYAPPGSRIELTFRKEDFDAASSARSNFSSMLPSGVVV
jgi:hypothetical protein